MRQNINFKNYNLKNRKSLYIILIAVVVLIGTLTIVYAALSTTLNINGNAEVTAASWDIYLNNPKVKSGSATTAVPTITDKNKASFSTTLNKPGDFYEFTIDVVNNGSIDAMIEDVVKTPELTTEQTKFLKYEIAYQNGESISTKQTLSKGTTMPITVRIEYRSDLVASDLPTGQVVLDLSLILKYIQSDGTGSSVENNGVALISANGPLDIIGTIVTIGTEKFYIIGSNTENVTLLSMYNLYVGGAYNSGWIEYGNEATGLQDETMKGYISDQEIRNGTIAYSTNINSYGDIVKSHINNYKIKIEQLGISVIEARLINEDELRGNIIKCNKTSCIESPYTWIYETSYWTYGNTGCLSSPCVLGVKSNGELSDYSPTNNTSLGVRPVLVLSKSIF